MNYIRHFFRTDLAMRPNSQPHPGSSKKVLDVQNLTVSFSIHGRKLHAVRGVSFDLNEGEAIGIVGESGCGKSVTVQSLTRLIPSPPSVIETGSVFHNGIDLLKAKQRYLRSIRGSEIGMIFQDPMTSLNPTMKIGAQILEGPLYHRSISRKEAKDRAINLLHLVGIPEPELRFSQFPHQLSGGMRQRVLIAIALAAKPRILIADEPTTALDPTIQTQILALLKEIQQRLNMSLILISHDIGVVARLCDRIFVMYAGKIVEQGSAAEVLNSPAHPYTRRLLDSLPRLDSVHGQPLCAIDGSPPSLFAPPSGCSFAPRCPKAMPICHQKHPPLFSRVSCWLYDAQTQIEGFTQEILHPGTANLESWQEQEKLRNAKDNEQNPRFAPVYMIKAEK
jgi:oligopeptide transport system ATP-binding protein